MDLGLRGKVALVAAASKGLGRAVAEELAAEGAKLALCSRNAEAIEAVGREIAGAAGVEVLAKACDISRPAEIGAFVEATLEKYGRVDILLTNSGGPPAGKFESMDANEWRSATELVLYGPIELARRVLPGMKERHWGRILNVTSIAVKQPVENLMLSNSLRAGLTGFARTLANEVAADGITVNNILPGYTRTERLDELANMMADKLGISAAEFRAKWE